MRLDYAESSHRVSGGIVKLFAVLLQALALNGRGMLHDIPGDAIRVEGLPDVPAGSKVRAVEVIVRMARAQA